MIKLEAAALTDLGLFRDTNEDCVWQRVFKVANNRTLGLFVVCDGMGGHLGGQFASYWAVETIKREFADLVLLEDPRATLVLSEKDRQAIREGTFKPTTPKTIEINLEDRVEAAIQKANNVVHKYAEHKPDQAGNAGTTITMAVVYDQRAIIANVGDSRAYLIRDGKPRQITRDHSLVASLVSEGQILPDEIYVHPQRNVIYRFLGQKGRVQADLFEEELLPGDFLLLCTDGLWEMVRQEQMIVHLLELSKTPRQACQYLIQAANEAGGEDNIGLAVVKVS